MCSNYEAVSRADRLLSFFGVVRQDQEGPILTWPTGMAPFIRLAEDGSGNRRPRMTSSRPRQSNDEPS